MNSNTVSIILPCYNEAEHLKHSVEVLTEHSLDFKFQYEFIFVCDKSTDTTKEILKEFEGSIKDAKFIYHEKNKGRGAAVKSGFAIAKGDIVGYIDIDLEVSPRYINSFVESLATNDVVIGNRKYYSKTVLRAIIRNFLSDAYRSLNKKILKHCYHDTEVGFKFFKREKLKPFFMEKSNDHWFWDTEFMMYCFRNKLKVKEIEVEFLRDNTKQSTVKVISDTIHYFKELIKFNRKLKQTK